MNYDVPKLNVWIEPTAEIRQSEEITHAFSERQPVQGNWGGYWTYGTMGGSNVSASAVSMNQMVNFVPVYGPITSYVLELQNQGDLLSLAAEISEKK